MNFARLRPSLVGLLLLVLTYIGLKSMMFLRLRSDSKALVFELSKAGVRDPFPRGFLTSDQWFDAGDRMFSAGNFLLSSACFKNSVYLDTQNHQGWLGLARCYQRIGKESEALALFSKISRIAPNDSKLARHARTNLIDSWMRLGLAGAAEGAATLVDSRRTRVQFVRLLQQDGLWTESIVALEKLKSDVPSKEIFKLISWAQVQMGNDRAAVLAELDSLRSGTNEPVFLPETRQEYLLEVPGSQSLPEDEKLFQQGRAFFSAKNFQKAVQAFEECVRLENADANCWYFLGQSQLLLGRFDQARESFESCLKIQRHHGRAKRGLVLLEQVSK